LRDGFRRERAALETVQGRLSIATPEILHEGEIEGRPYLIMSRLAGQLSLQVWADLNNSERLSVMVQLGRVLRELHQLETDTYAQPFAWQDFVARQRDAAISRQQACGANPEWLKRLPGYLAANLALLPQSFRAVPLHGDVHHGNLMLEQQNDQWRISGLLDFGDSLRGWSEYEFVAPGVLMMQGQAEWQRGFFREYGYRRDELDVNLRIRLMLLTILYECSDLRKYARRLAPDAQSLSFDELERAIWPFVSD
jgi:hygromycin-B 7''-O-kinase